jgi:hypothetical protein
LACERGRLPIIALAATPKLSSAQDEIQPQTQSGGSKQTERHASTTLEFARSGAPTSCIDNPVPGTSGKTVQHIQ